MCSDTTAEFTGAPATFVAREGSRPFAAKCRGGAPVGRRCAGVRPVRPDVTRGAAASGTPTGPSGVTSRPRASRSSAQVRHSGVLRQLYHSNCSPMPPPSSAPQRHSFRHFTCHRPHPQPAPLHHALPCLAPLLVAPHGPLCAQVVPPPLLPPQPPLLPPPPLPLLLLPRRQHHHCHRCLCLLLLLLLLLLLPLPSR